MVRQWTANPPCIGSNPIAASRKLSIGEYEKDPFINQNISIGYRSSHDDIRLRLGQPCGHLAEGSEYLP